VILRTAACFGTEMAVADEGCSMMECNGFGGAVLRAMLGVALPLVSSACYAGPAIVQTTPQVAGAVAVSVMTLDPKDGARARGAIDFQCRADAISAVEIAEISWCGAQQTVFLARGCGQVGRYACTVGEDRFCIREPLEGR